MGTTRRSFLIAAGGLTVTYAFSESALPRSAITGFKETTTTLFWVGEAANSENDFIPNAMSYWDKDWQTHYGGVDDPKHRIGDWPAEFRPKENPFYVALPYGEFAATPGLKHRVREIPWYAQGLSPILKNRWVEVLLNGRSCFAQWQDVGPCGEDDFDFVFGTASLPKNTFDARAGLDVSPAVWHYLGMKENMPTAWRFVESREVPHGPWAEIVTLSGNNR